MGTVYTTRVSQSFRLPTEVAETLEVLATQRNVSKTEIVIEAIERLGRQQAEELMTEGMRQAHREPCHCADDLTAPLREVVDEW